MKQIMRDKLGAPKVVDRSTFQAELDALRVRGKAHTREGDAIAAARPTARRRCRAANSMARVPYRNNRGRAGRSCRRHLTLVGAGCVKCLFRATRRQVIPRGWMSNTYDYLPDCFDHQLGLILVDVMAAVLGYEEACVRDEGRQILVRRTQDRFQCIGRKPLRLLRQVERTADLAVAAPNSSTIL
jgi:hypothetical protein